MMMLMMKCFYRCIKKLLPLHNLRSVLCILLILVLLIELSEAFIDQAPLSQVISLMAVINCWILHRQTEIRDGLGLAISGGAFTTISVARLWRLLHLIRYILKFILNINCIFIYF